MEDGGHKFFWGCFALCATFLVLVLTMVWSIGVGIFSAVRQGAEQYGWASANNLTEERLNNVKGALERYRSEHGRYPHALLPNLTTPVPYLLGIPYDPYGGPKALLRYYAPEGGGWILYGCGPDGVYDIDPETDYQPFMKEPSPSLRAKTFSPLEGGKGDFWIMCDPEASAAKK